jgi:hypothetical protein
MLAGKQFKVPSALTILLQHLVALVNDEELDLLQVQVLLQSQLQQQSKVVAQGRQSRVRNKASKKLKTRYQ